jgi:mono/diheme cytochrome c family protein
VTKGRNGVGLAVVAWVAVLLGAPQAQQATTPQPAAATPAAVLPAGDYRALLDQYCVTCHSQALRTGGLELETLDTADVPGGAEVWERVIRKVAGNMMPPAGMPAPDDATRAAFVGSLEAELDAAARLSPNPGRALLHRFNRAEYANAVRDLLALDVDPAVLLPPDDSSYGFDNIADVLGMSPLLMERYVSAAEQISALAVGDPTQPADAEMYRLDMDQIQTGRMEGLPVGTRGGTLIRHTFPLDGEYEIRVRLWKTSVGFVKGLQSEHQLEVSVDGERVLLAPVGGRSDYQLNVLTSGAGAEEVLDERLRRTVLVGAGPHDVAVTFLAIAGNVRTGPEGLRPTMFSQDPLYIHGMPAVASVTIEGPYNVGGPGDTPSRRAIFTCVPAAASDEAACAESILSRLARQAYRRPVTGQDVDLLMELYALGHEEGGFERGVQTALQGVLTSPYFLFRAERDPVGAAPGAVHALSDLELASRLSFFLWSSIPDEPLLAAAERGELSAPGGLDAQVRRMLADPRADALIENFGGQWLHLRNLESFVPDRNVYPEFDGILKTAMRRETELFLASVLRDDRNVMDLLDADYTYVNEVLARHYGLEGVYGQEFRRVAVTDPARRGLLGHASVLAVTSFPNRTSPVVRGRFVLEQIVGTPPPPPPPGVPPLPAQAKPRTMREQMEVHRASPACATCHRVMDPIGLALENFDSTGAWRVRDGENLIDASDVLADGTPVGGPEDLRTALLRNPEGFVGTLTEKLMTYALGRGVEHYDMPAVREIVAAAAADDYRASALIAGIVRSVPFRMRTTPGPGDGVPEGGLVAREAGR